MACPNDHRCTDEPEPRSFSFNSPFGACPTCHGLGTRLEVDPELVVPDPQATLGRARSSPGARPTSPTSSGCWERWARARLRPQHAVGGPLGSGPEGDPPGPPDQGPRRHPQPLRTPARLLRRVRGASALHRAPPQRGGVRRQPGALRGLHARGPLPGVPRQPPQAGLDVGDARRRSGRRQNIAEVCALPINGDGRLPARPRT